MARPTHPTIQSADQNTRHRILAAAEKLFAEKGFAATSLRTITSEANVNLAAVNYHFGSKENLFIEVLNNGFHVLNRERLNHLEKEEKKTAGKPVKLEKILHAIFFPAFEFFNDPEKANFLRVICRAHYEAGHLLKILMERDFKEIIHRFSQAARRAEPAIPEAELYWRMHFTVGAMIHSLHEKQLLTVISGGTCKANNHTDVVKRLITYAAAGIRAK